MTTLATSRRKGATAECRYHDWLLADGQQAARVHLNGVNDEGDIHIYTANRITVVEVKHARGLRIGEWLRELDVEIANTARHRPGVTVDGYLIVRPVGIVDPGRWWRINRAEDRS